MQFKKILDNLYKRLISGYYGRKLDSEFKDVSRSPEGYERKLDPEFKDVDRLLEGLAKLVVIDSCAQLAKIKGTSFFQEYQISKKNLKEHIQARRMYNVG